MSFSHLCFSIFIILMSIGFLAHNSYAANTNGNLFQADENSKYESSMGTNQVYMSPTGKDNGDCDTEKKPCRTFSYAISNLSPGDGLILLDGDYPNQVHGELRIRDNNGNPLKDGNVNITSLSAQIPSGVDVSHPTIVRAKNPGKVFIEGGFTLGDNTTKVQHIVIYGLTFFTHSSLHNANHVIVKACGFNSSISIGTQEHAQGCMHNLVEDVWVWGSNSRSNVTTYRSNHNIWRRVLIRDDGCDVVHCGEGRGNASIATTVYNSNNVIMENVVSIDRILRANAMSENNTNYSDFATAQHPYLRYGEPFPTPGGEENGSNQWLGCMAINSDDYAINFEADEIQGNPANIVTTITLRDFVALNTYGGISMDGSRRAYSGVSRHSISGVHLRTRNKAVFYRGCFTPNKSDPGCTVHIPVDPVKSGAVTLGTYTGQQSKILPQYQYINGKLSDKNLWPWPYESRIRHEICQRATFSNTGDEYPKEGIRATKSFCGFNGSLTDYIKSF